MPHWKLILAYDGTPYNGWQIQPHLPTIQGTLASAIHRITGETVLPQGSGRTDAGVHALAQVASFALRVPIPGPNLHRALNRALPPSIRALSVEPVPEDFHARHSARRKTYEYRIFAGDRICFPMLAPWVWPCRVSLDLPTLQRAAAHVLGTHDFSSFAASDPDLAARTAKHAVIDRDDPPPAPKSSTSPVFADLGDPAQPSQNTRTIFRSSWSQQDDLLIYKVTGSGFLHHMVRNLVGTFVEVSAGRIAANEIPTILSARDRGAAGPTAPASGLFLVNVEY